MLGCYFKTLFRYRPGLNRHDKLNLSDSAITDWEEANNASCVINTDYKILWVVNSENYIYKRNALNRAKQVRQRERERNRNQENCLPNFLIFRLTPACAPGSTRLGTSGTWSGLVST